MQNLFNLITSLNPQVKIKRTMYLTVDMLLNNIRDIYKLERIGWCKKTLSSLHLSLMLLFEQNCLAQQVLMK